MTSAAAVLFFLSPPVAQSAVVDADICIYGGTSAGISAAIQASRMGKRAVIAEPGKHLGGLSSGGLGATDIGNKAAIGGISREFYRELGKQYGQAEAWLFEPHVAEETFTRMLAEAKAAAHLNERVRSIFKNGKRITELVMENGDRFRAAMFIDCSYEGDLMAKSGVSYAVGREANSLYGETLNGIRSQTPKHQFTVAVDPYRTRTA